MASRSTHVMHVSTGSEVDMEAIESVLRQSGERRIIFVHDEQDDLLARCSDVVTRCRVAGVQVKAQTTGEYERERLAEGLWGARRTLSSPDSDAAIDAACRAGPRDAPALPGTEALVASFVQAQDLPSGPASRARPEGPMAAHLGEMVAWDHGDEMLAPERAIRVRVWPVLSLIGTVFVATDEQDVGRALEAHVQGILRLPVLVPRERLEGPLRKYLLMHASASTPPDPTTGQRMFLELYGDVAIAGTHDLRTPEGTLWRRQRESTRGARMLVELPGPLVIRLAAANWANVSYPRVGVPFYM